MKYNDRGEELPDDIPMEAPVKFRRPPSIQELIAMHVKAAMQVERKMGKEDDDDFEEDEESDDVLTPYEIDAYAGEANAEIRKAEETQKVLDKLSKKKDNNNTVDNDRIKEKHNVQSSGTDSNKQVVGDAGEKRATVGGKGRSAGDSGGGVPESGE